MTELLSGGYSAYVKNDYTKDKAELTNKIKKMRREYISEAHDNYRAPKVQTVMDAEEGLVTAAPDQNAHLLFNFFDAEEKD